VEYLKKSEPQSREVAQGIRDTVSKILLDVESEGITAVRRYSEELDGWNPDSFVVSEEEIQRAEDALDDELKEHIAFARDQVKNFAELQKRTLVDFEEETLPGVVLGQKQIPVNAVGSYSPGGRYPMFGSSIMTVAVPKVAGVKRVVAVAPREEARTVSPTASTSRCSTRWPPARRIRSSASAACRPSPPFLSGWRRSRRWT
jgi:sulfopropanediol 3-dehydrogenase